jgi:hypothetical protein
MQRQVVAKLNVCIGCCLLIGRYIADTNRPTVKISVSKDSPWEPQTFAKAPLELLLCDDLTPNSKLLWIILANQTNFGPINKSVLDRRIGIHRATRLRCTGELRDLGLISGTADHIIMHDPVPILRRLRKLDAESRRIVEEEMLGPYEEQTKKQKQPKPQKEVRNYFEEATQAWNKYRPANYSKINRISAELLKSIDLHISALGIQPHDYENFFCTLKAGVDHSPFWSKENTSKTLQSITGVGQPQTKKYQNVYNLYNEGMNHEKAHAVNEEDRFDEIVIKSSLRKIIDEYDSLHYMYFNMSRNDPNSLESLTDRILDTEKQIREAGLDPAKFRMKYQLSSWPSDVPEPEQSRQRFWVYDDEL